MTLFCFKHKIILSAEWVTMQSVIVKETVWLRQLIKALNLHQLIKPVYIHEDSKSISYYNSAT